ncbi:MAG: hypothetical protein MZV65_34150 [Chromatiales bacterium]|nr:hypothetical protein [Chromatiales bacterium]
MRIRDHATARIIVELDPRKRRPRPSAISSPYVRDGFYDGTDVPSGHRTGS